MSHIGTPIYLTDILTNDVNAGSPVARLHGPLNLSYPQKGPYINRQELTAANTQADTFVLKIKVTVWAQLRRKARKCARSKALRQIRPVRVYRLEKTLCRFTWSVYTSACRLAMYESIQV